LPEDKVYIAEAWRDHGGSFVSRLGAALAYADPVNTRLILSTWSNYVNIYRDQAIQRKEKSLLIYKTHHK